MSVLITGAAGVLGRRVAELLRQEGCDVIACGHRPAGDVEAAWDVALETAPEPDCRPDVVIHGASRIGGYRAAGEDGVDFLETNVTGTMRVVRWCASRGVRRLVHLSSAIVYGEWHGQPREASLAQPWLAGPYAVSKWCGEQVAQLFEGELIVLRLTSLYGAGYRTGLVPRLLERAHATGEIELQPPFDDAFDLLHVADAARTVAQAAGRGASGVWNIGSGRLVTIRELGETCARHTGARLCLAESTAPRAAQILNWTDDRKARTELAHRTDVSLDKGIAECALHYRGQSHSALKHPPIHGPL